MMRGKFVNFSLTERTTARGARLRFAASALPRDGCLTADRGAPETATAAVEPHAGGTVSVDRSSHLERPGLRASFRRLRRRALALRARGSVGGVLRFLFRGSSSFVSFSSFSRGTRDTASVSRVRVERALLPELKVVLGDDAVRKHAAACRFRRPRRPSPRRPPRSRRPAAAGVVDAAVAWFPHEQNRGAARVRGLHPARPAPRARARAAGSRAAARRSSAGAPPFALATRVQGLHGIVRRYRRVVRSQTRSRSRRTTRRRPPRARARAADALRTRGSAGGSGPAGRDRGPSPRGPRAEPRRRSIQRTRPGVAARAHGERHRLGLGLLRLLPEPAALDVLGDLRGDPPAALAVHLVVRRPSPRRAPTSSRAVSARGARRLLLGGVRGGRCVSRRCAAAPSPGGRARLRARNHRAALPRVHADSAEARVFRVGRTAACSTSRGGARGAAGRSRRHSLASSRRRSTRGSRRRRRRTRRAPRGGTGTSPATRRRRRHRRHLVHARLAGLEAVLAAR